MIEWRYGQTVNIVGSVSERPASAGMTVDLTSAPVVGHLAGARVQQ